MNRKEIRVALANLLRGGVPSANEVLHYMRKKVEATPAIFLTSGGSHHTGFTRHGFKSEYGIFVSVFVLHTDPDPDSEWTSEMAEDTLDAVEQEIVACIAANQTAIGTLGIEWQGMSNVDVVSIDGVSYLCEIIPIKVSAV